MKTNNISIDKLEEFSIPLSGHSKAWVFLEEYETLSPEYLAQIIPLNQEASLFLEQYIYKIGLPKANYEKDYRFKDTETIYMSENISKWLYRRGIPFAQKVFWISDGGSVILTWKMVIKFWQNILGEGYYETICDKTLNWRLTSFDGWGHLEFSQNRIYNAATEGEKMAENQRTITEAQTFLQNNKLLRQQKYNENPYLK
jgi:hypothetical protein